MPSKLPPGHTRGQGEDGPLELTRPLVGGVQAHNAIRARTTRRDIRQDQDNLGKQLRQEQGRIVVSPEESWKDKKPEEGPATCVQCGDVTAKPVYTTTVDPPQSGRAKDRGLQPWCMGCLIDAERFNACVVLQEREE